MMTYSEDDTIVEMIGHPDKNENGTEDTISKEENALSLEFLSFLQIDSDGDCSKSLSQEMETWCSRNVLRKQRHWEKSVTAKKSKRRQEKERRKAKQSADTDTDISRSNQQQHSKRFLKALTKERLLRAKDSGPRLCIDLSMTDHMSKKIHATENSFLDLFPLENIIYLTPDSDNALEDIDPCKVYVLGGLVDESIQKVRMVNLKVTYHKARENGLQTARLPIQEYMVKNVNVKNFHSEILAINQVFDVLSTFYGTRSWPEALKAGVSPGKGFVLSNNVTFTDHHVY
ncbi:tRNA methyltransferase 10 homolog B isoform 3-T3 [Discoglossus pictus]